MLGGEKKLSLIGGLTSFGGAGNNYSMHALTEMTRQLRQGKGRKGLVLCNGGMLTYQFAVVLGTEPRSAGGYTDRNPLEDWKYEEVGEGVAEGADAQGEVVVEVCVMFPFAFPLFVSSGDGGKLERSDALTVLMSRLTLWSSNGMVRLSAAILSLVL